MSRGYFKRWVLKRSMFAVERQATVDVFIAGTNIRATIYNSKVGGTPLDNPILGGHTGEIEFWTESGSYDIIFSAASVENIYGIPIFDYYDVLTNLTTFDSDDLSEGSVNFYFTNERVDDRVSQLLQPGTGITLDYDDVANTLTINASSTADQLTTPRTISISGDATGSGLFDGSADLDIVVEIQPNSVELGIDTVGNYVETLVQGAGVIIIGLDEEGSSKTIAHGDTSSQSSVNNIDGVVIQDVILDQFGHITTLNSVDLDLRFYTQNAANAQFVNVTGDTITGSLTVIGDINGTLKGNADSATILETARTFTIDGDATGNVDFDGSSNVTLTLTIADDSHNHTSSNITDFVEASQDAFAQLLAGSQDGVLITYDDVNNVIVVSNTDKGSDALTSHTNTTDPHAQYHNDVRALAWLLTRSTTDVAEGDNLYYTQTRFDSAFTLKSTTDLVEGLNLYFTNERVDDRVASLFQDSTSITWSYDDVNNVFVGNVSLSPFTTDDLTEGSNLYYTQGRFDSAFAAKDTDDLAEGTNLYFTDERVDDRVATLVQNGTGITWTYDDILNTFTGTVTLTPFTTSNLVEGSRLYYTQGRFDSAFTAKDTDDLVEGSNLYYTQGRFDSAFAAKDTDDLVEGINLYFTDERVDDRVATLVQNGTGITWTYDDNNGTFTGTVSLSPFTTDNLNEGSNNLYFTNERVDDRVASLVQDGTGVSVVYDDGANTLTVSHADTSTQASVVNSNGTAIKNIVLDDFGHITAITSYNLDGRYYTKTLGDARYYKLVGDSLLGNMNFNGFTGTNVSTPTVGTHIANKDYVDSKLQGLDWQESVLDKNLTAPPVSPSVGDRYIIASPATGVWATHEDNITEWDGTSWIFIVPDKNTSTWVEDEDLVYTYNDISWVQFGSTVDHGSLVGLADDDHLQYHTDGRALTWLGTRSTDDLPEGSANLYFDPERVDDQVAQLLVEGDNISLTYGDPANTLSISVVQGTGSGLDADLLDGLDSLQFLRSDQGDTASGLITFTNGAKTVGGAVGNHFQSKISDNSDTSFMSVYDSSDNTIGRFTATGINGLGLGSLGLTIFEYVRLSPSVQTVIGQNQLTPLAISRGGSSTDVNISFNHTANTTYFGIDANGNFRVGTNSNLNSTGDRLYHDNYHPFADDADTVDGLHAGSFVRGDGVLQGEQVINITGNDFVVEDNNSPSESHIIWVDQTDTVIKLGAEDWPIQLRGNLTALDVDSISTTTLGMNIARPLYTETWLNGADGATIAGDFITGDLGEYETAGDPFLIESVNAPTPAWFAKNPAIQLRLNSELISPVIDLNGWRILDPNSIIDDANPYQQTRVVLSFGYRAYSHDTSNERGYFEVYDGTQWVELWNIFADTDGSTHYQADFWKSARVDVTPYINSMFKFKFRTTFGVAVGDFLQIGSLYIHESEVPLRLGHMMTYPTRTTLAKNLEVSGNVTASGGFVGDLTGSASLFNNLSVADFQRVGHLDGLNTYIHRHRNSINPPLYINQTGTGDIARFIKGSSAVDVTSATIVRIDNNANLYSSAGVFATTTLSLDSHLEIGHSRPILSINPGSTSKTYQYVESLNGSENLALIMRGDNVTDRMSFMTDYGSTGDLTERVVILASSGNVGVNNINPSYKLDVTGTARATKFVVSTNTDEFDVGADSFNVGLAGVCIRPSDGVDPSTGDTLFAVRSGTGSPRFVVQHNGRLGSTNTDMYLSTATDMTGGNRVFHDGYKPLANAWTTARTLTLAGDATGSVSVKGNANMTLTVVVLDDSHTHDTRYYTETESDTRFTSKLTTNLGTVGGSTDTTTDTALEWSDLPIGYSNFMASSIGTIGGLPSDNGYYFTKLANRNIDGGWTGLAYNYGLGDFYVGHTATSANFATWKEIITRDKTGATSGFDADTVDGYHANDLVRFDVINEPTQFEQLAITDANASLLFDGVPTLAALGPTSGGAKKRITCNDGSGNFNIWAGGYYVTNADRFVDSGDGAAKIIMNSDVAEGSITLKTAVGVAAANDDPITWGKSFTIKHDTLTWGGDNVVTINGSNVLSAQDITLSSINVTGLFTLSRTGGTDEYANVGTTATKVINITGTRPFVHFNVDIGPAGFAWGTDLSPTATFGGTFVWRSGDNKLSFEKHNADEILTIDFDSSEVIATGTISAQDFNTTSDVNKKKNIKTALGIDVIAQLRGVEFDWVDEHKHSSGVIAQEVEQVVPHLVNVVGDHKTVNYNGIIAYLIEAIKDQQTQIRELQKIIKAE